MKQEDVDLEPLRTAIRKYKMMAFWRDSFEDLSAEDLSARAKRKALEAKVLYVKLIIAGQKQRWRATTPKPGSILAKLLDGKSKSEIEELYKLDYEVWAAKKALGLRTSTRYTAQAIGGKHWQAWGKPDSGHSQ